MDSVKSSGGGGKKSFLLKTWERCRSIPGGISTQKEKDGSSTTLSKSKSCNVPKDERAKSTTKGRPRNQVAPEGCFSVYVGPGKQRFAIKAKYANHPLFKMLLEDAESEYGYNSDGPILLPCEVDLFYKVLAEMEMSIGNNKKEIQGHEHGCGFVCGSCSPFHHSRRLGNSDMAKGYGSYGLLTPSRLIKMN